MNKQRKKKKKEGGGKPIKLILLVDFSSPSSFSFSFLKTEFNLQSNTIFDHLVISKVSYVLDHICLNQQREPFLQLSEPAVVVMVATSEDGLAPKLEALE